MTQNTCKNPLILNYRNEGYKVNKPLDQSGEYVDKSIADEMLSALIMTRNTLQKNGITYDNADAYNVIDDAINNATK